MQCSTLFFLLILVAFSHMGSWTICQFLFKILKSKVQSHHSGSSTTGLKGVFIFFLLFFGCVRCGGGRIQNDMGTLMHRVIAKL